MQNVGSSTYVYEYTVNTIPKIYQNENDTNMTTTFPIEHDKFYQVLFFTADMIFMKSLLKKLF